MPNTFDLVIRAKAYVSHDHFRPAEGKAVCVKNGLVAAVLDSDDPLAKGHQQFDFGDAVILPGFVNCHTHLDLSHLRGQPLDGSHFGDWLSAVVSARSAPKDLILTALSSTLSEMISTGTCAVLDVLAQHHASLDVARAIIESGIKSAIAIEALCPNPDREDEVIASTMGLAARVLDVILEHREEDLAVYVERAVEGPRLPCVALSPHAPYTVSPRLYATMSMYAARHMMLQTTHLSEATSEREFLTRGGGPLLPLFKAMGADVEKMRWTDQPGVEMWMRACLPHVSAGVNQTLLVHCYDLTDAEVARLGSERATVVYCPRSRAYFGHSKFRFADLMAAGATITLGTDSLGSNQDLDLMQELAAAREEQPDVPVVEMFRAATVNGQRALSAPQRHARARAMPAADLQVVGWPSGSSGGSSLLSDILAQCPACLATVIDGRIAHVRA